MLYGSSIAIVFALFWKHTAETEIWTPPSIHLTHNANIMFLFALRVSYSYNPLFSVDCENYLKRL
jgi:hypothetical protein